MIPPGLIPEGVRDRLPPQAEAAAALARSLTASFAAHGYERIQPPLIEYEESLGTSLSPQARRELIRFTDPASQETLALRSDMTGQIGRIATTRLVTAARPLRLSYAGPVVRVRGNAINAERESIQTGVELIGSDSIAAASEILFIAVEALATAGVTGISVDLTLPDLIETLAGTVLSPAKIAEVKRLLDSKDAGGLIAAGLGDWLPLLAATGPVDAALFGLKAFDHAGLLASRTAGIAALAAAVQPQARVTLDPTERHGFGYHAWIGFSIFGDGIPGEAGRGGAYLIPRPDGSAEAAVGFSLYIDGLVDAGLGLQLQRRVLIPLGTDAKVGSQLRSEGWSTVAAFTADATAQDFRCTHIWNGVEAALI